MSEGSQLTTAECHRANCGRRRPEQTILVLQQLELIQKEEDEGQVLGEFIFFQVNLELAQPSAKSTHSKSIKYNFTQA